MNQEQQHADLMQVCDLIIEHCHATLNFEFTASGMAFTLGLSQWDVEQAMDWMEQAGLGRSTYMPEEWRRQP